MCPYIPRECVCVRAYKKHLLAIKTRASSIARVIDFVKLCAANEYDRANLIKNKKLRIKLLEYELSSVILCIIDTRSSSMFIRAGVSPIRNDELILTEEEYITCVGTYGTECIRKTKG